jgi:hypothetical protein
MGGQQSKSAPAMGEAVKEVDETRLCDVLPYCSERLGLQGLACLAASSKQYNETALATTASDAAFLLKHAQLSETAAAAGTAAAPSHSVSLSLEQHTQEVAWLLRAVPSATTAAIEHLLRVPSVPISVAKQLVSAGVRMRFSQLTLAAEKMVQGVEVWVVAQRQLGVMTDIPGLAVALHRPSIHSFVSAVQHRQFLYIYLYSTLVLHVNLVNAAAAADTISCVSNQWHCPTY